MRSIAMVLLAMTLTGGPLVAGAQISQTFTYTGAVQVLTLTTSGLYHLTVNGAAGGGSYKTASSSYSGGTGAEVSGDCLRDLDGRELDSALPKRVPGKR